MNLAQIHAAYHAHRTKQTVKYAKIYMVLIPQTNVLRAKFPVKAANLNKHLTTPNALPVLTHIICQEFCVFHVW